MLRLTTTETKIDLAETLNRVAYGKERVIIHRRGKELAAIIPIEDLKTLERLIEEEEDRRDLEEVQKALADPANSKTVPLEKVGKKLGLL